MVIEISNGVNKVPFGQLDGGTFFLDYDGDPVVKLPKDDEDTDYGNAVVLKDVDDKATDASPSPAFRYFYSDDELVTPVRVRRLEVEYLNVEAA